MKRLLFICEGMFGDDTRAKKSHLSSSRRSHILKVNETIKTILVCYAGQAEELALFAEIALKLHQEFPKCAVRILAADCPPNCQDLWISHHPGIECDRRS
ncbi:MAG: hypothetical protein KME31_32495 [Tolypothrix carrinoi HA7290-LM1]|jgi:hypothetical protein|nr:hypothetical protein [Tolypothrix carrinoi HA7290-LM1]